MELIFEEGEKQRPKLSKNMQFGQVIDIYMARKWDDWL